MRSIDVLFSIHQRGWDFMNFEEKKAAVKRGAQRELELSMKPGEDPQIIGPFYDVHVEGKYLGWCSKAQRDELQKIYDQTPSQLRRPALSPPKVDLQGVQIETELALTSCKRLEGEVATATPKAVDESLGDIRVRLERVYETILKLKNG